MPNAYTIVKSLSTTILISTLLVTGKVSFAQQNPSVIALFGDSISFGFNQNFAAPGSDDDGLGRLNIGQPAILLSQILRSNRRSNLVANFGNGGSSSGPNQFGGSFNNGVDRITADLVFMRNTYPGNAYYVLIMYGTNDFAFGISPSSTGFNNQVLIDRTIAQGATPLVATIPPCACQSQSAVISVNNNIRAAVTIKRAQGKEAYLVDHYTNLLQNNWASALVDPDGVHPNDAGYGVIAQHWFDNRLSQLIETDTVVISPVLNLLLDE